MGENEIEKQKGTVSADDDPQQEEFISNGPKAGFQPHVVFASLIGSLGSFSFGYNLGSMNAIEPRMKKCPNVVPFFFGNIFSSNDPSGCFKVGDDTWGYISSILCLGALAGCILAGKLVDKIGRKSLIIWNNAVYIGGLMFLAFAINPFCLLVGRALVGLGIGVSCVVVPMYLTEISSWDVRGVIGSMHQFSIVIGYLASLTMGLLVTLDKSNQIPWSWRVILGFDLLPSIAQIVMMYWYCPESPKYLFKVRGDTIQGEFVLRWLRGNSFSSLEYNHYCKKTSDGGTLQRHPTGLFKLLMRYPESHKSLFIIAMLHLAQQLSGINAIFYFSTAIFDEEKSSLAPYVPILIALLNVFMTVVSLALMDRAGRRILLLSSVAGMVLAYIGFTSSLYFSLFILKAISVLLFVAAFAIGMGPVPWLMLGEIFAPWCAGAGVTLGVSVNWIFNFLVVASFQPLRSILGKNVVLPYLIFLVIFGIWAFFGIPETKGKPANLL